MFQVYNKNSSNTIHAEPQRNIVERNSNWHLITRDTSGTSHTELMPHTFKTMMKSVKNSYIRSKYCRTVNKEFCCKLLKKSMLNR